MEELEKEADEKVSHLKARLQSAEEGIDVSHVRSSLCGSHVVPGSNTQAPGIESSALETSKDLLHMLSDTVCSQTRE